jgi:hypothetical protein
VSAPTRQRAQHGWFVVRDRTALGSVASTMRTPTTDSAGREPSDADAEPAVGRTPAYSRMSPLDAGFVEGLSSVPFGAGPR